MSIERELSDLTAAIIANTMAINNQFEQLPEPDSVGVIDTTQKQLSGKAPPPPDAVAAAETNESPTPTAEEAATEADKPISGDKLNTILKKEFVRIGNVREPIDLVMKKLFDVDSLHNLKPENFAELVTAVAQIPSA